MTTRRSRGRSMSTSRRLCSRAPRTEIRSGSPAGTALGAGRTFGTADTALATAFGVAFFPLDAGCARFVAVFARALADGSVGASTDAPVAAFLVPVAAALGARFAAGRAGAAFATFFAAFRSAMGAPYPRERVVRTYVPGLADRV